MSARKGWFLVAVVGLFLCRSALSDPLPGGTLDPTVIPKYVEPLVIPPAMPKAGLIPAGTDDEDDVIDYYEIEVVQFDQQILPTGFPQTTVWSYAAVGHPETRNYPAFTVEAKYNQPVRVKWINNLIDEAGDYLPHLLPVDQTLHWANPLKDCADGTSRTDCTGDDPSPYLGPVPMVTHVHGAHVGPESDGYPEAWWLPGAQNIPADFATQGALFDQYDRTNADPGTAVFQYPNDQRATTLWYHDHTLGMTRLNVYAGPAGFWLIRGGPDDRVRGRLPAPAPRPDDEPGRDRYYEVPIVVQDRSFDDDGSLFYPASREFFDGFAGPYVGDPETESDISPIWNPEAFFNTMVVNGRTWPVLEVEQRRYRLRYLNGCNSRFLILKHDIDLPFHQVGAEGGFLPQVVELDTLVMAPAERADVVVDFSDLPVGAAVTLLNLGPDEPFKGFNPDGTLSDGEGGVTPPADPETTGQVMQFVVVHRRGQDNSSPPSELELPAPPSLGDPDNVRKVSLNEEESAVLCLDENGNLVAPNSVDCVEAVAPKAAVLGTVGLDPMTADPVGMPLLWGAPITEDPTLGSTEVWMIYNFTEDAHPIHLHLVQFQVVNREGIETGDVVPPEPWETGWKDTVIAYPGEITRIKAQFDIEGLYVWHCHIVEHEDNEMMRPYRVVPPEDGGGDGADGADAAPAVQLNAAPDAGALQKYAVK